LTASVRQRQFENVIFRDVMQSSTLLADYPEIDTRSIEVLWLR